MSQKGTSIQAEVREYIVREFLYEEGGDELTSSTPLISGGVLDSISTVKLVSFLEDRYDIRFDTHEISAKYLETLDDIAATVERKKDR